MAMINFRVIRKILKEKSCIHEKVDATYSILEMNGVKYFQIDTYSRNDRECKGKISQSIQFDRENAMQLITILQQEFEIIDNNEIEISINIKGNGREVKIK